jgi:rubrerythrin
MKTKYLLRRLAVAASILVVAGLLAARIPAEDTAALKESPSPKTLANLLAAYTGESNAHARYLVFAQKAQDDGYLAVASLFRAAARGEEIHASNHAQAIKGMGAEAKADLKEPVVGTTKENLKVALEGENYEQKTMYPDYISQAETDKQEEALQSFRYAMAAETEHAKLMSADLRALEVAKKQWTFYVCPVCGRTTSRTGFEYCPVCATPEQKFEKFD